VSKLARAQGQALQRGRAAAAIRARVLEQVEARDAFGRVSAMDLIASSPALLGSPGLDLAIERTLEVEAEVATLRASLAEALDIAAKAESAATVAGARSAELESELAKLRSKSKKSGGGA